MISRRFSCLMLAAWLLAATAASGQDYPDTGVTSAVFVQGSSTKDVDEQIKELQSLTKDLEQQLDNSKLGTAPTTNQLRNVETVPDDSPDNSKVTEIKKNLELLRQVIKDKRSKAIADQMKAKNQNQSKPESLILISDPQGSSNRALENLPVEEVRVPKKVLDKIVNAFELGNSLFLAGNIDQAIKYYEVVPAERLGANERNWLEFMIATCHQRQQNFNDAEAGFRNVAGFKDAPRLSKAARESLQYIVSRKRIDGLVKEYTSKADAALQKANNLIGGTEDGK